MTSNVMRPEFRRRWCGLGLPIVLSACGPTEPPPEPHTPVAARAVNYTDQGAFFRSTKLPAAASSPIGRAAFTAASGFPTSGGPA